MPAPCVILVSSSQTYVMYCYMVCYVLLVALVHSRRCSAIILPQLTSRVFNSSQAHPHLQMAPARQLLTLPFSSSPLLLNPPPNNLVHHHISPQPPLPSPHRYPHRYLSPYHIPFLHPAYLSLHLSPHHPLLLHPTQSDFEPPLPSPS